MKLFKKQASAATEVLTGVTDIVDRFILTKEERNEYRLMLSSLLQERWFADQQGSWLTRNIRPLVVLISLACFMVISVTDGNIGQFQIRESYIQVYEILLMTSIGGYFVARSVDKRGNVK